MSDGMFYTSLTDEEIDDKISKLTPFQKKKFDRMKIEGAGRRQALLIARSYPLDIEEDPQ